jgi:hypothetical protein
MLQSPRTGDLEFVVHIWRRTSWVLVVPLWHPLQLQVTRKREAEMGKYCKQRPQLDLIVAPTTEWPELALISILHQKDEKKKDKHTSQQYRGGQATSQ